MKFLTHQSARSNRLFRKIMTKGTLDRNEYFKESGFSRQLLLDDFSLAMLPWTV